VVDDVTDKAQLVPMIDEAVENQGQAADVTTADAGYFSGEQLEKAEEKGYEVLVNDAEKDAWNEEGFFDASQFAYDETTDTYECPAGQTLEYSYETPHASGTFNYRVYQTRGNPCKNCPLRPKCTKSCKGRRVRRSPHEGAMARNSERVREKGELLERRKEIVEPTFGTIKRNHGFVRWSFRGLDKVKVQWAMICTAVNLRKIFKYMYNKAFSFENARVPLRALV
jgi:transposase